MLLLEGGIERERERETDTVPDLQRKAVGYMRDK